MRIRPPFCSTTSPSQLIHKNSYLALILLIGIAIFLRIHNIGNSALWNDEAYSWAIAKGSYAETIKLISHDFHPPAYYLLLSTWVYLIGDSIGSLRSLSLILAIGSIALTYIAAKNIFGTPVGLLTAVIVSINSTHILWSQIVRGYSLLYFSCAVCFLGISYLCHSNPSKKDIRTGSLIFGLGGILAIYTHNTGLLMCGTLALGCYIKIFHEDLQNKISKYSLFHATNAVVLISYLPWLSKIREQSTRLTGNTQYADADWTTFMGGWVENFLSSHLWSLRTLGISIAGTAFAIGIITIYQNRQTRHWLVTIIVALPLVCIVGYIVSKPVFLYVFKTSRWYNLFTATTIALGLIFIWQKFSKLRYLYFAVFFSLATLSAWNSTSTERVRWDLILEKSLSQKTASEKLYAASTISLWAPMYYGAKKHGKTVELLEKLPSPPPNSFILYSTTPDDPEVLSWLIDHPNFGAIDKNCLRGACYLFISKS